MSSSVLENFDHLKMKKEPKSNKEMFNSGSVDSHEHITEGKAVKE